MCSEHVKACIAAQRAYCDAGIPPDYRPHFAPKDGICWDCGRQIYTRVTLDEASTTLITGCRHCCRSYCE